MKKAIKQIRANWQHVSGWISGLIIGFACWQLWKLLTLATFGKNVASLNHIQFLTSILAFIGMAFTIGWVFIEIIKIVVRMFRFINKHSSEIEKGRQS